jgi:hypothetical protein
VPQPALHLRQPVQVILNDRNRTPHRGRIRRIFWHYTQQRWYFLLRDDSGREISKRYTADVLQPAG